MEAAKENENTKPSKIRVNKYSPEGFALLDAKIKECNKPLHMINGKAKGSSYERHVAWFLSSTFQEHTGIECAFRRNVDSGSFFGGKNKKRVLSYDTSKATFGDIICPDTFKYIVECKALRDPPTFRSLVYNNVLKWNSWIKQVEQDAANANKEPMIMARFNRIEDIVMVKKRIEDAYILKYHDYYLYLQSDYFRLSLDVFFTDAERTLSVKRAAKEAAEAAKAEEAALIAAAREAAIKAKNELYDRLQI